MNTPFQNRIKKQQRRNEKLMRKAARISARQSGESMGGIDYELPKVQKVLGKINKAKTISYNDVDPRIEEQGKRYDSGINYGSPLNSAYASGKKTQVKSDSPLGMYAYVSTAPHFQRLQDNIAAAFTPKKKTGPTSEDKKNQAEEAYWKSKTTTSEENNPFKDRANQIKDDSSSNFDVDLKYNPSTDYSGSYEDSKKGNPFYTGKDKNENIFNKFR
jgi:chromatin remodeling complex protein RSC6